MLVFSANTAFADFPKVCRVIAEDRFLPVSFATRGRGLFTQKASGCSRSSLELFWLPSAV